jgi:peptidoglycan/xylan/chitin deacetylase (PgdA/CDA1 family)
VTDAASRRPSGRVLWRACNRLQTAPAVTALGGSLCGVRTDQPVFGLTFDDGPDPANTPPVLAALAQAGAGATFFVLASNVAREPRLVRSIQEQGHEIALHGDEHIDLTRCSPRRVVRSIAVARRRVELVTGRPVRWFRPPYGAQSPFSYLVARLSGMEVVCWSASARDWLGIGAARQVELAMQDLAPGGILLMHDGPPRAPAARIAVLEGMLEASGRRGWRATGVGDLLALGEADHRVWFRDRARALTEEVDPLGLVAELSVTGR